MCKPCLVGWLAIAAFAFGTFLAVKRYKQLHGCRG